MDFIKRNWMPLLAGAAIMVAFIKWAKANKPTLISWL